MFARKEQIMAKKKKEKKSTAKKSTSPLGGNPLNYALIGGLVVLAFIAGTLWTRLKKSENAQQQAEQQAQEQAQAPQQEEEKMVLGEEEVTEILKDPVAVKGEEDAPITIVEFSEYLCPFCAEYAGADAIPDRPIDEEDTLGQIMENYIDTGKVRYIFRDFPVHGESAKTLSIGAYCAGEQDKYWEMHDLLFEKQAELYEVEDYNAKVKELAGEIDLNEDDFSSCIDNNDYTGVIDRNYQLGQEIGVRGTPTFYVNGNKLVGAQPYSAFEQLIEQELKQ